MVGLTGSRATARMREILTELKRRGIFVVVGDRGAVREDYFVIWPT